MTLPINLSTGPVQLSAQVMRAMAEKPLSHRSAEFRSLFTATTNFLCKEFHTRDVYILSGSGTLANEVMMQEINQLPGRGLILANGEFGTRLMQQASRNNISYFAMEVPWGHAFDTKVLEKNIKKENISWVLFCHCETSTGVINDLETIASLCSKNQCSCFVDCMSTVGTMPLNLSNITMATASSGKGLASIPGLAIIFANTAPKYKPSTPVYLDLFHYQNAAGIPFTLASNLLKPLYVSILQKLGAEQYERAQLLSEKIFALLGNGNLVPFAAKHSRVFTIILPEGLSHHFMAPLNGRIELSGESDYLKQRGWKQLALFGNYREEHVTQIERCLQQAMAPGSDMRRYHERVETGMGSSSIISPDVS